MSTLFAFGSQLSPSTPGGMSSYIIPDRRAERYFPVTLTPTSSVASTVVSFDSLDSAQISAILEDNVPTRPSAPSEHSMTVNTSALPSSTPATYPCVQHERFFFDDGNITFLAEGILYRVHRYFFCRDSNEFRSRLSKIPTHDGASSPPVVSLENVKSKDFDAFLSILYPPNFNTWEERPFEEWSSILELSTRWGFTNIRDLAVRCLKPPSSNQRLILGRKYAIDAWIVPALVDLCQRLDPLSLDEARLMNFEDVVLIGSVRERVRSHTLAVEKTEIEGCIDAWMNEKPWSSRKSVSVPPGSPPPDHPFFGGAPEPSLGFNKARRK